MTMSLGTVRERLRMSWQRHELRPVPCPAGGVTTSDASTNAKVYPQQPGITPDRILAGQVRPSPLRQAAVTPGHPVASAACRSGG